MHSSGISIWFFIGVLLIIYGAMILGYGVFELVTGTLPMWCWPICTRRSGGVALMLALGLFYGVRFRPGRNN